MKILTVDDILPSGEYTVLTVGNFDGVHRGHQKLLSETVRLASKTGSKSAAVTFDPSTRLFLSDEGQGQLLTTFEEKAVLIGMSGVDYLMRVPFDGAMRQKAPETFIKEILVDRLHIALWVHGHGHTFGRNRSGNENVLHIMKSKYHFKTFISDLLTYEGSAISSTLIRECVMQGRITEAVMKLGHPYLVSIERIPGKKLGTKLGYPTLNFKCPSSRKVIPLPGVYAAELEYEGAFESGALYFGGCPTLQERGEVHFEFYSFNRGKREVKVGERMRMWLYAFIRGDIAFAGTNDLTRQIGYDIETIKSYFTKENVQWR